MKLIAHNMLQCVQCQTFPLLVRATEMETRTAERNDEFLLRVFPRLDYRTLLAAAARLGLEHSLPADQLEIPAEGDDRETILSDLHRLLFEVVVINGALKCDSCGREYEIADEIPNMVIDDMGEEAGTNSKRKRSEKEEVDIESEDDDDEEMEDV